MSNSKKKPVILLIFYQCNERKRQLSTLEKYLAASRFSPPCMMWPKLTTYN